MEKKALSLEYAPGTEKPKLMKAPPKKPKRSRDKTQEAVDLLMEVHRKKSHLTKGEKVVIPRSVGSEGRYVWMKLNAPSSKGKGTANVPPTQHFEQRPVSPTSFPPPSEVLTLEAAMPRGDPSCSTYNDPGILPQLEDFLLPLTNQLLNGGGIRGVKATGMLSLSKDLQSFFAVATKLEKEQDHATSQEQILAEFQVAVKAREQEVASLKTTLEARAQDVAFFKAAADEVVPLRLKVERQAEELKVTDDRLNKALANVVEYKVAADDLKATVLNWEARLTEAQAR